MKNKIKNIVIVTLSIVVIGLSVQIRSARYENKLQRDVIRNWSDLSDFQDSKQSNLVQQIHTLTNK